MRELNIFILSCEINYICVSTSFLYKEEVLLLDLYSSSDKVTAAGAVMCHIPRVPSYNDNNDK